MLLQCLAALLLLGDPLGLEGCQHSVQPQPLQALWARREAKCSERVPRPPAREDSGKPPIEAWADPQAQVSRSTGAQYCCFEKKVLLFTLLSTELKAPPLKSANQSLQDSCCLQGKVRVFQGRLCPVRGGRPPCCCPLIRGVMAGRSLFSWWSYRIG